MILLLIGIIAYYGNTAIVPTARSNNGFAIFYTAAHVVAHRPHELPRVYDDEWFAAQIKQTGFPEIYDIYNINPPTFSLVFTPLLVLPPEWGRIVWLAISLLALVGGLLSLMRTLRQSWLIILWLLPFCLFYGPVRTNIDRNQLYLDLFLAHCVIFWALVRKQEKVAGVTLGLLLILKTTAVWLSLLLLLTRHWRVIGYAALTAAGVGVATLPWLGVEAWLAYAARLPELANSPLRYLTAYQTIHSLFGHLLVYDRNWNPAPVAHWPLVAFLLTQLVFFGALLLSLRWAQLDGQSESARILTIAMFLALGVTNAPFAEDYHYCLVLPAVLVAGWWYGRHEQNWSSQLLLGTALVLLTAKVFYKDTQLTHGWLALLAYPRVYGAYLLWGWLLLQLRQVSCGVESSCVGSEE